MGETMDPVLGRVCLVVHLFLIGAGKGLGRGLWELLRGGLDDDGRGGALRRRQRGQD